MKVAYLPLIFPGSSSPNCESCELQIVCEKISSDDVKGEFYFVRGEFCLPAIEAENHKITTSAFCLKPANKEIGEQDLMSQSVSRAQPGLTCRRPKAQGSFQADAKEV